MNNEDVLKSNKEKNIAKMKAHHARFGIGRPLARSVNELIAISGRNPLIGIDAVEIPAVVDDKPPCGVTEQELIIETAIRDQYDIIAKPKSGPILTCSEILAGSGLPGGKVNANALAAFLARLGFQQYSSNGRKGYRLQGITG